MRVLLKISWEALAWDEQIWIDYNMLNNICDTIVEIVKKGVEIALVVGAWNYVRWADLEKIGIDRCNADNMGMLAVNMNAIALADILGKKNLEVKQVSSFSIDWISDRFNKPKTIKNLQKWYVVVFWWWTWNPYFTTDSAWVLRALEIEADMMVKATKVNWVYDKDPEKHSDAKLIKKANYDEVITNDLRVMDPTAITLAKENNLVLKVVSMYKKWAVLKSIFWEDEGTTISRKS